VIKFLYPVRVSLAHPFGKSTSKLQNGTSPRWVQTKSIAPRDINRWGRRIHSDALRFRGLSRDAALRDMGMRVLGFHSLTALRAISTDYPVDCSNSNESSCEQGSCLGVDQRTNTTGSSYPLERFHLNPACVHEDQLILCSLGSPVSCCACRYVCRETQLGVSISSISSTFAIGSEPSALRILIPQFIPGQ